MKVRVRTAIQGPNKRGKYRALLIVDGRQEGASPWMSEKDANARLDEMRGNLLSQAAKGGIKVTLNPGHRGPDIGSA